MQKKKRKTLQEHLQDLLEVEGINFERFECGNNSSAFLSVYLPIAKIRLPQICQKDFKERISFLSSPVSGREISRYLHSGLLEFDGLKMSELVELLEFSREFSLVEMKGKVGIEVEKKLKNWTRSLLGKKQRKLTRKASNIL